MNRSDPLLAEKKLFVLDLDGTFYLDDEILPGSAHFLRRCRETGKRVLFFTNNSSHTADFYRRRLTAMGCDMQSEYRVLTSGDVAIRFLLRQRPGARVFLLGNRTLRGCFAAAGVRLDDENPDTVVAAFDSELCYEDLFRACAFLRGGAGFFATNPDFNCPVQRGLAPDCGSICALLTAATGRRPAFLGKPFRESLNVILNLTGAKPEEMAFVGDRLETDIAIGANNGITTALVLCGATRPDDLKAPPVRPDRVFPTLGELGDAL